MTAADGIAASQVPASPGRIASVQGAVPGRLVEQAFDRALRHAREGTPLPPFLLTDSGALDYLFDGDGRTHPVELAVRLMLAGGRAASASMVALAMGTRITTPAGRQSHAVLVLACAREADAGDVWAQAWRPRRWYRGFAIEGAPWRVGTALNLFRQMSGAEIGGLAPVIAPVLA